MDIQPFLGLLFGGVPDAQFTLTRYRIHGILHCHFGKRSTCIGVSFGSSRYLLNIIIKATVSSIPPTLKCPWARISVWSDVNGDYLLERDPEDLQAPNPVSCMRINNGCRRESRGSVPTSSRDPARKPLLWKGLTGTRWNTYTQYKLRYMSTDTALRHSIAMCPYIGPSAELHSLKLQAHVLGISHVHSDSTCSPSIFHGPFLSKCPFRFMSFYPILPSN